jgi:murein DD-endopeptidase MepM/ murein hydrolase activator NlpD
MTHDGDDGPRKHRPLPSVDMALLPHELRALRVRQVTLVLLGLLLTAAALSLSVARPWVTSLLQHRDGVERDAQETSSTDAHAISAAANAGSAAAPLPSAPEAVQPVPIVEPEPISAASARAAPALHAVAAVPGASPGIDRSTRAFGRARGFRDALVSAGVSGADADALVSALDKLVDFRRARPEDELLFERDAGGQLVAFEYRASMTERFRAERKPDGGFKGARIKVDVEHRRIARGGFIADSLGKALEALGIRSNVAGAFVEAFEGRIDFKKHSRQGDSFKLILDEDYIDGQSLGYGRLHALQYKGERSGEAVAVWFEPEENGGDFYDENGRAMHGGWLRTPLRYDHISSPYNLKRRHPILNRIMPHEGIDYAAAPGTPVWAAADGVVTFAGVRGANGNLIALQHSGGYETFYAHLLRMASGIKRGAKVRQRQPIGAVGSTGRSTGPHLHFGLKRNGRFLDPATQLNGPGKSLPESLMPKFKRMVTQLKHELAAIALAPAPAPSGDAADTSDDFHEDTIDL